MNDLHLCISTFLFLFFSSVFLSFLRNCDTNTALSVVTCDTVCALWEQRGGVVSEFLNCSQLSLTINKECQQIQTCGKEYLITQQYGVVYPAAQKCTHHSSTLSVVSPPKARDTVVDQYAPAELRHQPRMSFALFLSWTPPSRLCSQRIRKRGCRTSSLSWLILGFSNKLCTSIHVQHLPSWFMAAVPLKNTSLSGYHSCSRVPPKHGRPFDAVECL